MKSKTDSRWRFGENGSTNRDSIEYPHGLVRELGLARAYGLSAYDAAYRAAALNTGATLATNDRRSRDVCGSIGIDIFSAR